jgi:hypothetical protein
VRFPCPFTRERAVSFAVPLPPLPSSRRRPDATQAPTARPPRRWLALAFGPVGVLLGLAATLLGLTATASAHGSRGRTFYVAPWGSDANRGRSQNRPWRTVGRVDQADLHAGDTVLFQGGQTFTDNTLMPGIKHPAAGTRGAPITYGSWGAGRAKITGGVWLGQNQFNPDGPSHLVFKSLVLGPDQGFHGTGNYITLEHLWISGIYGQGGIGIQSQGSHWVIKFNEIDHTADSGMLLGMNANSPSDPAGGSHYFVYGNSIEHTGLDGSLDHAAHGIYLKVADATVSHNKIIDFRDDGVSVRYRGAHIVKNYLATGAIGIAWYQYDHTAGTSEFVGNTIAQTTEAGIFVCGVAEGCVRPIENFIIRNNRLAASSGPRMNLQPTRGHYRVAHNP